MRRILCAILSLVAAAAHASASGLQPRDINGDGTVDVFYDPAQNISLTADANLPATMGLESGDPNLPLGMMGVDEAFAFASGLNFFGTTGWRLPLLTDVQCDADGNCHMVACELSSVAHDPSFRNAVANGAYWLGSLFSDVTTSGHATFFEFFDGRVRDTDERNAFLNIWLVHDGDIKPPGDPPAAPEPATWAAVLAGLAVMGMRLRRRRSSSERSALPSPRRAHTPRGQWVVHPA